MKRPVAILLVILLTCFLSTRYSEHHPGDNSQAFQMLYMHLQPAALVGGGDHADEGHATDTHDDHGHGGAAHVAAKPLVAIPFPFPFAAMDGDHNPDNGRQLVFTNLQLFQIAAVILIFLVFGGVAHYLRTGEGDVVSRTMAGFCMYVRDEMAAPVMGREEADRFLPLFLSLFFFILFMNLMGLVPGSATPTANIFVTGALALITFGTMVGCGMTAQGPVAFWKNLVPHVPGFLWPLMFVVEVLGLLVKPFALMIRLFANMTGGHMVVLSFMGLIFLFAGVDFSALKGVGIAPVAVAFAVFIMIIEAFVAMVQAYIFTQLSIIFVGASIHPEH